MMLSLTEQQRDQFLSQARRDLVQELITQSGAITKLSPAQAGGYLDVTPATLAKLPIDIIDMTGTGKALRYDLADLKAYELSKKTKRKEASDE